MTDILGRELKDGDVVVVKGNGGSGSPKPMAVGVFYGESVRFPDGTHRTAKDMFLVENPGELERKIKDAVEAERESKKKAAAVALQTRKAQQANVVGKVYQMKRDGTIYLYCGERRVVTYVNGEEQQAKTGHLYLQCGFARGTGAVLPNTVTLQTAMSYCELALKSYGSKRYEIMQSFKSYEKEFHTVDIPRSFEMSATHKWKSGVWNGKANSIPTMVEHTDEIRVVISGC